MLPFSQVMMLKNYASSQANQSQNNFFNCLKMVSNSCLYKLQE
jgi:hypothetical protein